MGTLMIVPGACIGRTLFAPLLAVNAHFLYQQQVLSRQRTRVFESSVTPCCHGRAVISKSRSGVLASSTSPSSSCETFLRSSRY